MTGREVEQAFKDGRAVFYRGHFYPSIRALRYYRKNGVICVSAELEDLKSTVGCVYIADPAELEVMRK